MDKDDKKEVETRKENLTCLRDKLLEILGKMALWQT